jgi:hypothetical protein
MSDRPTEGVATNAAAGTWAASQQGAFVFPDPAAGIVPPGAFHPGVYVPQPGSIRMALPRGQARAQGFRMIVRPGRWGKTMRGTSPTALAAL